MPEDFNGKTVSAGVTVSYQLALTIVRADLARRQVMRGSQNAEGGIAGATERARRRVGISHGMTAAL